MSEHMNDASLSVMFNISEGFLRRRDGETLQFLRYSFASNGELKAGYYAADSRSAIESDAAGPRTKDGLRTKNGPGTKNQAPRTAKEGRPKAAPS